MHGGLTYVRLRGALLTKRRTPFGAVRLYHDRRGEYGNRPDNQLTARMVRYTAGESSVVFVWLECVLIVVFAEMRPPAAPESHVDQQWAALVNAYRFHGYRCADLDPLNLQPMWKEKHRL